MDMIGVCVIPVELVMNDILAGMRRLGPLQCDCGLADIGCPEIARLRWHTFCRHIRNSYSMGFSGILQGLMLLLLLFAGWELHLVFGLVIMKRKLRKLNKIQTNQCGHAILFVCRWIPPIAIAIRLVSNSKMLHDIDEVTHAQQSLHQHFEFVLAFCMKLIEMCPSIHSHRANPIPCLNISAFATKTRWCPQTQSERAR